MIRAQPVACLIKHGAGCGLQFEEVGREQKLGLYVSSVLGLPDHGLPCVFFRGAQQGSGLMWTFLKRSCGIHKAMGREAAMSCSDLPAKLRTSHPVPRCCWP
jgi:hypothetical protein